MFWKWRCIYPLGNVKLFLLSICIGLSMFLPIVEAQVINSMTSSQYPVANVLEYGAFGNNKSNDVVPFQKAIAFLKAAKGGTLYVPKRDYYFHVASEADTLLIDFDNFTMKAEEGTIFRWDYYGLPLIAIIGANHVNIGNINFIWSGTRGGVPPLTNHYGYKGIGKINPSEWASDIVVGGSNFVLLHHLSHVGLTTENNLEMMIALWNGTSFGPTLESDVVGNVVEDVSVNDVYFGIIAFGQDNFTIRNIHSDRYMANGHDGPGHVVYMTSILNKNGRIDNIVDNGTPLEKYVSGANTVKLAMLDNCVVDGIHTKRDQGSAVLVDINNTVIQNVEDMGRTRSGDPYTASFHTLHPQKGATNDNNVYRNIRINIDSANKGLIAVPRRGLDVKMFKNNRWENIFLAHAPNAGFDKSIFEVVGINTVVKGYKYANNGTADKMAIFLTGTNITSEINFVGQRQFPRVGFDKNTTFSKIIVETDVSVPRNKEVMPGNNIIDYRHK